MDKNDIVSELDKLKLKIMLDDGMKSSDEVSFDDWIDEMQMKKRFECKPWALISNERYSKFSLLKSCVSDLFYKKHSHKYKFHKYQPELREILAEVVAMTMFYQEELENKK